MNKFTALLGLGLFVLSTAPLCADVVLGISGPHPVHYHHRHRHHVAMGHGERGDRGNGGDHGHDGDHGGPGGGPHH